LVTEEIRPALEKGITVIADRYTGSTVAYQGAGRGLNREVIDYVNDFVTGGLIPDVTLLLDSEPAEGLERVGSPQLQMALLPEDAAVVGREDVAGHRRFEDQAISFHRRVRRGYLELAGANPGWHIIDARLSIDELADQIWTIISPLLKAGPDEAAADTAALVANNE
jgi:dTMP kinase